MNSRRCVLVALQGELTGLMLKLKDLISENEELMTAVRDSLVTGAPSLPPPPPRPTLPESQVKLTSVVRSHEFSKAESTNSQFHPLPKHGNDVENI